MSFSRDSARHSLSDVHSKAAKPRTRRALEFWGPLNAWCRTFLDQNKRRPSTVEVGEWYELHAESTWGNLKPSCKEARAHANCLRPVAQVKAYFRKYRARSKGKGAKHDQDEDLDQDGMQQESPGSDCQQDSASFQRLHDQAPQQQQQQQQQEEVHMELRLQQQQQQQQRQRQQRSQALPEQYRLPRAHAVPAGQPSSPHVIAQAGDAAWPTCSSNHTSPGSQRKQEAEAPWGQAARAGLGGELRLQGPSIHDSHAARSQLITERLAAAAAAAAASGWRDTDAQLQLQQVPQDAARRFSRSSGTNDGHQSLPQGIAGGSIMAQTLTLARGMPMPQARSFNLKDVGMLVSVGPEESEGVDRQVSLGSSAASHMSQLVMEGSQGGQLVMEGPQGMRLAGGGCGGEGAGGGGEVRGGACWRSLMERAAVWQEAEDGRAPAGGQYGGCGAIITALASGRQYSGGGGGGGGAAEPLSRVASGRSTSSLVNMRCGPLGNGSFRQDTICMSDPSGRMSMHSMHSLSERMGPGSAAGPNVFQQQQQRVSYMGQGGAMQQAVSMPMQQRMLNGQGRMVSMPLQQQLLGGGGGQAVYCQLVPQYVAVPQQCSVMLAPQLMQQWGQQQGTRAPF